MITSTRFTVSYRYRRSEKSPWVVTERGSNTANWGLPPAQSETAVLSYLRRLHPGTEIMIVRLSWY